MRFGIQLPLEHCTLQEVGDLAERAERLGFDWISVADHFVPTAGRKGIGEGACLESTLALAVIAHRTRAVRCGLLVANPMFRHPVLMAKIAATLDQLSGGRLELGIGAGWLREEHVAFGVPFPELQVRAEIVEETLQILRRAFSETGALTFEGRHFALSSALFEPKPLQQRLPLWVGAADERRMIPIAARWADGWNLVTSSPTEYLRKRERLEAACEPAKRDPATIKRSVAAVTLGPARNAQRLLRSYANWRRVSLDEAKAHFIVGDDDQVEEWILDFAAAGVDLFVFILQMPVDDELLSWLGERVEHMRPESVSPAAVPGTR